MELLAIELQGLLDDDFDIELTGFSLAEIDIVLDDAASANPNGNDAADDVVPGLPSAFEYWRGSPTRTPKELTARSTPC